jgi:UDP-GlcNAc:undecaprenyl-phosphate GlcNAc-1-phosphate transferase
MVIFFGFAGALLFSALSMPLILKVAHRRGLYDAIDERKIHTGNIPRLGGLGIFVSFLLTIAIISTVSGSGINTGGRFWALVVCMLVVHLVGLIDDFKDLRARYKFFVELAGATLLVALGFRFDSILVPFGNGSISLGLLSYPLTVIWIIGITNALNLIDGMDGLAGGIAAFAAAVFGVFFLLEGDLGASLACFILLGSIFGFLVFNLPPAKIFMGDSGALFLGFTLAVLPLLGSASGRIEIGIVPAVSILLIPIFDTFTAMIRRRRSGVSVFTADKLHLHHKLLDLGLNVRGALSVIYLTQTLLCLIALSVFVFSHGIAFFINICAWVILAFLFYLLGRISQEKLSDTQRVK